MNKLRDLDYVIELKSEKEILAINNGLLFIYADWSSESIIQEKRIIDFLIKNDLELKDIYALNNDLIDNVSLIKKLNNHGKGELHIFKDSQIIEILKVNSELNILKHYIK